MMLTPIVFYSFAVLIERRLIKEAGVGWVEQSETHQIADIFKTYIEYIK
jgi:hypothetical protein